jgi:hypothetical protein
MKPIIGMFSSALILAGLQPVVAQVQPARLVTAKAALEQLFTAPDIQSEWFAPTFLKEVPLDQIQQGRTEIQKRLGNYKGIQKAGEKYVLQFEKGQLDAIVRLDDSGKIAGLLLNNPQ